MEAQAREAERRRQVDTISLGSESSSSMNGLGNTSAIDDEAVVR